tara:strand:- start:6381 stop:6971 length:591 start_codon:yes stop_codon:yes gene_type:complete
MKDNSNHSNVKSQLTELASIVHGEQRKYQRKSEFFSAIQHDLSFLSALELLIIKQKRFLSTLTADVNKMTLAACKIQVEHFESLAKHAVQKALIADKFRHYEEIFVPNFDRKLKMAKKRWQNTIGESGGLISEAKTGKTMTDNLTRLEMIIDEGMKEIERFASDDEMQWIVRADYLPRIQRQKGQCDKESLQKLEK